MSYKPLFKWTGGKNRMFDHYSPYFYPKDDFDTFVDCFFGAGSISTWIIERYPNVKFVINDFNSELILMYRQLSLDGDTFIRKANEVQKKFRSYEDLSDKKKYYDELRYRHIDQRDEPMDEAVQLYCMMRVNFNGWWKIYDYSNGRYASHMGVMRENIISIPQLKKWSEFLSSKCTILNSDFSEVESHLGKKSYIYFDPPYRDSFTLYTDEDFNENDQLRLCDFAEEMSSRGHYVSYSNKEIGDGFFEKNLPTFNRNFFGVNYTAGRGTSYNDASEILATNFQQGNIGLEDFFA